MDTRLIETRREEIATEVAELRGRLKTLQLELDELAIVERVINRLTGSPISTASTEPEKPGTKPTIRQMIKAALMDARQRGVPGLLPKDIRAFIKTTYGQEIGQQVNTTASRMWHELKEIEKDQATGAFFLPKEKPADDATVESPSAGFDRNQGPGREAGQGGAT
ncbi:MULTISPECIES: hypothetical protein [Rhizobium]|jgi:hypothetical protein|uniref:hypothetical protein n=1 Tax=Rhizobium TaxID=379 RepID=UPI001030446A|nr:MULTISPECIES: hypothetical protein [Rhizobium]TBE08795.1 hypothetical protein ELH12_23420 [Rhizobium ruizarguesonis]WSH27042.1 hypothetical protein U8P75_22355 [Rhizobium beringeri]WSH79913.1 hypothetical protein U8P69_22190 [Rhizobium beringeri]